MTGYVIDVVDIFLLFALFGILHSYLASNELKRKLKEKYGALVAFYRIIFNIISFFSLYIIYVISPKPHIIIYDLPSPFDLLILIPQFLSLAGFFWTLKYFCVREFLGINQIFRWVNNEYNAEELDEHLTLRIEGPYRFSRHPLYLFSILFLGLRPEMDLFYIMFFLSITAYFFVGSHYEEKKLIERFGSDYKIYRDAVPRIFPYKFTHPYNKKVYD